MIGQRVTAGRSREQRGERQSGWQKDFLRY
jgi:hypothetical protein